MKWILTIICMDIGTGRAGTGWFCSTVGVKVSELIDSVSSLNMIMYSETAKPVLFVAAGVCQTGAVHFTV